ncbi:MAG: hypothetical protein LBQ83_01320 [Candidatus Margulisbacteria bacterium]|jgi:microcystin-dependent protein|nr:hypothetical protein [Candidatus Margulisiibacteriota bacterium]
MTVKTGEPLLAEDVKHLKFLPKGTILMYDGSFTDNETLVGWYKCTGQTTPYGATPNLVDKFIRGSAASGAGAGADSVTLTSAHIPAHTHTFSGTGTVDGTAGSAGAHTHTTSGTAATGGGHTHTTSGTAASNGAHEHTVSGTASLSGSTGSYGTASNTAVPTIPVYYKLIYIIKMTAAAV